MRITAFDIRRDGHPITGGADTLLTFPRTEMADGKLFISDADRLYALALLLEVLASTPPFASDPRNCGRKRWKRFMV